MSIGINNAPRGAMLSVGLDDAGRERLKNLGHNITPSLQMANARIMTGGGSVMGLEAQKLLLKGAVGNSGINAAGGFILSTYV